MKRLAFVLCVTIVAGAAAPVVGQPFADTPANHWAYEALAHLAAKGLIQGYPDGTFKGDRTMTRYEMAMVVARVLARIESIKVPPPPGAPPQPDVTKEDIDLLMALVNELRQELTDKEVRLPKAEALLNAIKPRVGNVKISGALEIRYDLPRTATGAPLNGNPTTGSIPASASTFTNLAREVFRLQFDGGVTPDLRVVTVLITGGFVGLNSSTGFVAFNSGEFGNTKTTSTTSRFWTGRTPSGRRWRSGSAGSAASHRGRRTRCSSGRSAC